MLWQDWLAVVFGLVLAIGGTIATRYILSHFQKTVKIPFPGGIEISVKVSRSPWEIRGVAPVRLDIALTKDEWQGLNRFCGGGSWIGYISPLEQGMRSLLPPVFIQGDAFVLVEGVGIGSPGLGVWLVDVMDAVSVRRTRINAVLAQDAAGKSLFLGNQRRIRIATDEGAPTITIADDLGDFWTGRSDNKEDMSTLNFLLRAPHPRRHLEEATKSAGAPRGTPGTAEAFEDDSGW